MADHVVIQVRDDIVTRLNAITSILNKTFVWDDAARKEGEMPCVLVEMQGDQDEPGAIGFPAPEDMLVEYLLRILVEQTTDCEKAAHNIRADIESVLLGTVDGKTLGGKVQWLARSGADNERTFDGEKPVYRCTLRITAHLRHLESQPTSFVY